MGTRWRELDLDGGGLQSASARLARILRRRPVAYALLALFPLGAHRFYLADVRGGVAYTVATLAAIGTALAGYPLAALAIAGCEALAAVADGMRTEGLLAALNKRLRMEVHFSQGAGAPPGFRGHYTDDTLDEYLRAKDAEVPGHARPAAGPPASGRRTPSFAEQEQLLREIARRKGAPPRP